MFVRPSPLRFSAARFSFGRLLAADTGTGSGTGGGFGQLPQKAEPGMVLADRYQLIEPIAAGGMAQVWLGQDLLLVRQVAIKVLHPHLGTDEGFVARFRREAVASARLSHRSIVAIYDTISEGGLEAIVMELIEGKTLRAHLDEAGVLPPSDVVDVGMQISAALDEAHRAGIVHRDIKPANIMVGSDRRIMVTDFGIAKAQKDADLTQTGTLLGTAKYLAPEQVAGEPVDPRADIYALGVVLFEAVTGKPPFLAENDAGTALARLQGEVPRCRHRLPTVPVGLDAVIAKAMARHPHERFDRASTFRSALAAVDLRNVRPDTSDLGPAASDTGRFRATKSSAGIPVAPPGAAPPPTSTAVLSTAAGRPAVPAMPPPVLPGAPSTTKLSRKQRKAAKKTAKAAAKVPPDTLQGSGPGRGRTPRPARMPIDGRQRPTKVIVASLIIAGLLVSGALLVTLLNTQDTDLGDIVGGGGSDPVAVAANPFDPLGDGTERPDLAPNAIDNNLETFWRTDTYDRAGLGGLKTGLGLVLDLEDDSSIDELELATANQGWRAQIFIGEEFGPNDRSFEIESLGEPAGVVEDGDSTEVVSLDGTDGSQVLIWITETGVSIDRNGNEVFRFVLYEASPR